MFANIGHVEQYAVISGNLYPGDFDAFLVEFPEALLTPGSSTDYLRLGAAGARLATAVDRAEHLDFDEVALEDRWRPMRAELLWAARLAATAGSFVAPDPVVGGPDPLFDPAYDAHGPTEIDAVVRAFGESRRGHDAARDISSTNAVLDNLVPLIVEFATSHGHARLESWGPRRVTDFLLRHVLSEVWLEADQLCGLPNVLRQWVHFTNERCEMPASMATETIERISEATPLFDALLRAREDSLRLRADELIALKMTR